MTSTTRALFEACVDRTHLPSLPPSMTPEAWIEALVSPKCRASAREALEHARVGDVERCRSSLVLAEAVGGYEQTDAEELRQAVSAEAQGLGEVRRAAARAAAAREEAEAAVLAAVVADVGESLWRSERIAGRDEDGLWLTEGRLVRMGEGFAPSEMTAVQAIRRWSLPEILTGMGKRIQELHEINETEQAQDSQRVRVLRAIVTLLRGGTS